MLANSGAVSAAGVLIDDLLLSVFSSDAVVNKGVFNRSFGTRPHYGLQSLQCSPDHLQLPATEAAGMAREGMRGKRTGGRNYERFDPQCFGGIHASGNCQVFSRLYGCLEWFN